MIRLEWLEKIKDSESEEDKEFASVITLEKCLPEYAQYKKAVENRSGKGDSFTENLLAIRFAIPAINKTQSFRLPTRLPGDSKKLPVAVGARSWLLNTCKGEWTGNLHRQNPSRVTFVGLAGLSAFMQLWACSCAVHDQPLPVDLWQSTPQVELPEAAEMRNLILACETTLDNSEKAVQYRDAVRGWMGTGASADRDSTILLATAYRLGFNDGGPG